ncbi:MAG: hypothetical protein ACLTI1_00155 [Clostridia bacterium]
MYELYRSGKNAEFERLKDFLESLDLAAEILPREMYWMISSCW